MTRSDACDTLLHFFGHIARVKDKKWENPSHPSQASLDRLHGEAIAKPADRRNPLIGAHPHHTQTRRSPSWVGATRQRPMLAGQIVGELTLEVQE